MCHGNKESMNTKPMLYSTEVSGTSIDPFFLEGNWRLHLNECTAEEKCRAHKHLLDEHELNKPTFFECQQISKFNKKKRCYQLKAKEARYIQPEQQH